MIYALVDATRLGFEITPNEARALVELGERINVLRLGNARGGASREP